MDRPEMALFVGLQASGKSTFYRTHLTVTHLHVSKDNFRNARRPQRRQLRMVHEALGTGLNVAVDNTNPSPEEWRPLIDAARAHEARVVGYWFPPNLPLTLERNAARRARDRVPDVGIYATRKLLRRPSLADGFDEVRTVISEGSGVFTVLRDRP